MNSETLLHNVDWEDDGSIGAFVTNCLESKRRQRSAFERQAMVNLAWYRGHQFLYYNERSKSLVRKAIDPRRANLIYNLIMPYVDHQVAQLGMDRIIYDVLPASDDQDDVLTAESATQVLRSYQDVLGWEHLEEEVDLWQTLTGEAYVKVVWDPLLGQEIDLEDVLGGRERATKYVSKKSKNTRIRIGDLDVFCVDPRRIFWGPRGAKFSDAEWVLEVNLRSRNELAERYDVDPDELSDGYLENVDLCFDDEMTGSGLPWKGDDGENCATVELWRRPCAALPDGFRSVSVGKTVLRKGPIPYSHKTIPIRQFAMARVPGKASAESYVTQLIGPQSDFNRAMSQMVEIREGMSSPFFMARKGSIDNPSEWNGRAGGVRFFTGDSPPTPVQGSGAPSSMLAQLQRTEMAMQDIMGTHDVSRAKVPAGVKSGRAILALQERDDQRLARVRRRRAREFAEVGRLMLQTLAQYVTEPRLVRILGDDDTFTAKHFLGESLRGKNVGPGVDYYDVRVQVTGMPMSRTAQIDLMESLMQYGALDPKGSAKDRALVLEALNLQAVRRDWDPNKRDRQNATSENAMLMRGQWIEPRSFDDHEEHIREHEAHCKAGFFRGADVNTQLRFELHIRKHMELMARKALLPQQIMSEVVAAQQATERRSDGATQGPLPQGLPPQGALPAQALAIGAGSGAQSPVQSPIVSAQGNGASNG